MAATTTQDIAASAPAEERMDPRRVLAFLAMVFGMFMSILDIQIVSASLAEIQAGVAGEEGAHDEFGGVDLESGPLRVELLVTVVNGWGWIGHELP